MWRFIFVSFAFLGWSFYELSGGADYTPATNSIQVRAQLNNERPKIRPVEVDVTRLAENGAAIEDETVTRSITSLADLDLSGGQRFEIKLARAEAADAPAMTETPKPQVTKAVATDEDGETALPDHVAKAVAAASLSGAASDSVDRVTLASTRDAIPDSSMALPAKETRRVTGNVVNMRGGPGTRYDRIAKLRKDDEVVVLQEPGNGWIKLRVVDTGRVGWMADWLVTAAN
jgi:hypothetical protein